nr:eukaryotic translation initiation factor 3 subunit b [Quercus suber]
MQWSPLGTYLAIVRRQGAAGWGGANTFNHLMRYAHPQSVVINILDVRIGKVMRDFKGGADDFTFGGTGVVTGMSWPVFRWAGGKEDKYFARIWKNIISVYETDTFSLIDKKSLKVENVVDFSWSPTDLILALFILELVDHPARVSTIV